jgi:hypothetical protein
LIDSNCPSPGEANDLLIWAEGENPGKWANHCRHAADAARKIALACGMDGDRAYVFGLLHDIGRFDGVRDLHHVIAGSRLMEEKGFPSVMRICLTHSFPIKNINVYSGQLSDCTESELGMLTSFLESVEYNDYDRLIQLCDALCLSTGVCLVEQRLIDVGLRYGINPWTMRKWKAVLDLKRHFDELAGMNIYSLFKTEICKTIFGDS